ncbi:MAG: alpha-glucuronidase [Defluviitaleaceae bacterium]|nr:alpha-glucuronidase [Defluviitaleaceae bacterium]
MQNFDLCWLDKASLNGKKSFETYFHDGNCEISKTIRKEVGYFFNTSLALKEQADLIFEFDKSQKNEEGFKISHESEKTNIKASSAKGLLYGFFELIRQIQQENLVNFETEPENNIRMLQHWDNIDGSVERGYAGKSIFYKDDLFVKDKSKIYNYVRLAASTGINAISINNVNVHKIETGMIREPLLSNVKELANIFRGYGIKLFLSVNFAAPIWLGELETSDPLEESVRKWWKDCANIIYKAIPDFGGFVVKADSEGRPGPFAYNRTHMDGANMLAEALNPHGGIVFWRCFVYNHLQDWRDRKTDRARAAYDHFLPLDGKFHNNVILQIKNGPMDFQVREATSPLFGGLRNTNQVIEFQVAHEYTGQAKNIFYLPKQFKEILDFDTYADGLSDSTIAGVIKNLPAPNNKLNGIVAVSGVGDDYNLAGHKLSEANLYGYGRLTWNPKLCPELLAKEWIEAAFNLTEKSKKTLLEILLSSYNTYESYTAPLGIGWMVNISHHYGPAVNGYEYDKWGTYHFSDRNGLGVDRTVKTGTGYTSQYQKPNFELYENIETCPDELLLFFHHVPYTHKLKSGKTVIQHIYDTHFEGVLKVEQYIKDWANFKDEIDTASFENVEERLNHQLYIAKEWRDQINTYYYRMSGIEDIHGRTIYR